MEGPLYVQFGCGWCAPEGWLNFDASPTLRFERVPLVGRLYTRNASRFPKGVRYGDIVRGLPVPKESCKALYCSHVLEHLSLKDCRRALRNAHKILMPGGTFRLVLPDLEHAIRSYVSNDSPEASVEFMKETLLGLEERPRGPSALGALWLGNSKHLWMWDYKGIAQELSLAGFVDIRRAWFGDASDPKFALAEEAYRWENCLGVDCRKPD
jgi:hypothetical protein